MKFATRTGTQKLPHAPLPKNHGYGNQHRNAAEAKWRAAQQEKQKRAVAKQLGLELQETKRRLTLMEQQRDHLVGVAATNESAWEHAQAVRNDDVGKLTSNLAATLQEAERQRMLLENAKEVNRQMGLGVAQQRDVIQQKDATIDNMQRELEKLRIGGACAVSAAEAAQLESAFTVAYQEVKEEASRKKETEEASGSSQGGPTSGTGYPWQTSTDHDMEAPARSKRKADESDSDAEEDDQAAASAKAARAGGAKAKAAAMPTGAA